MKRPHSTQHLSSLTRPCINTLSGSDPEKSRRDGGRSCCWYVRLEKTMSFWLTGVVDYTLNNPDTLTKYKTAAQISHKVLEAVTGRYSSSLEFRSHFNNVLQGWCIEDEKILSICERGDKLLAEEVAKVYKGKKISKGQQTESVMQADVLKSTFQRHLTSHDGFSQLLRHSIHAIVHGC